MNHPSEIKPSELPPSLEKIDLSKTFNGNKDDYEKTLKDWQHRMLKVQQAYYRQKRRAIIVFEGWDASGKGGAIRRLTEKLDPRGMRVYPISAPEKAEQGRHYLFRFYTKLPKRGMLAIFDRSYYGRVLVERVEGLATKRQWQRAYQEINEFERTLVDDGVRIVKVFLHIDRDEQIRRFTERLHNPDKQWKLTHEDIRNHQKWDEYEEATEQMFQRTATQQVPWHVIAAQHKWYARIKALKTIVTALEQGVDVATPALDKRLVKAAESELGIVVKHSP